MQMKCVMQGMPVSGIQLGWRVGIADLSILNGILFDLRQPVLLCSRGPLAEFGRVHLRIEAAGVGTKARVEHEIVVAGPARMRYLVVIGKNIVNER